MTAAIAYSTVAASTLSHAYWNYLLKRAGGGQLFVTLSKCTEVALLTPGFVIVARASGSSLVAHWPLSVVGAAFVVANYVALSRAYTSGPLSTVYPLSRGGILLFLPLLGFMMFGERLSAIGVVALATVTLGIGVLALPDLTWSSARAMLNPKHRAIALSLLAAFTAALYTAWSKHAMRDLAAFPYFYAYTLLTAIALLAMVRRDVGTPMRDTWRAHRWSIVRVAVLNSATFLLVLLALREATSSYVVAVRQLSIAWSVMLGRYALEERITAPQKAGVALILAGCGLVAFA